VRGDRAELEDLPENLVLWREICCDADNCQWRKCEYFSNCFLFKMRKEAEESQLVIVNHHLFFADLNLKMAGRGTLMPEVEYVIFDEAHMLEEIALEYFSVKVAPWHMHYINRDLERKIYKLQKEIGSIAKNTLLHKLVELLQINDQFFNSFSLKLDSRFVLNKKTFKDEQEKYASNLISEINSLVSFMKQLEVSDEEWQLLMNRVAGVKQGLEFILKRESKGYVYWGEAQEKGGVILNATPIEVSGILKNNLWNELKAAILTSATLSSHNGFEYIKLELGIEESKESIYKSPFNYKEQSILYIPTGISEPMDYNFVNEVAEQVRELIEISKGRAFILFTSVANMKRVYELLDGRIRYPIFVQGEKPKTKLIEEFKKRGNAILLGTSSFWQGVDIVGSALSCVIIDKLPFSVPSDPVIEAKIEDMRRKGHNPFYEFQLPEAILLLKQGLGRLIRSKTDVGIMALLDKRVYEKNYGKYVLQALSEMEITNNLDIVIQKMGDKL